MLISCLAWPETISASQTIERKFQINKTHKYLPGRRVTIILGRNARQIEVISEHSPFACWSIGWDCGTHPPPTAAVAPVFWMVGNPEWNTLYTVCFVFFPSWLTMATFSSHMLNVEQSSPAEKSTVP